MYSCVHCFLVVLVDEGSDVFEATELNHDPNRNHSKLQLTYN